MVRGGGNGAKLRNFALALLEDEMRHGGSLSSAFLKSSGPGLVWWIFFFSIGVLFLRVEMRGFFILWFSGLKYQGLVRASCYEVLGIRRGQDRAASRLLRSTFALVCDTEYGSQVGEIEILRLSLSFVFYLETREMVVAQ